MAENKNRIAFITTCKDRLHHLKETLPLLVADGPTEIVVVDYDCPAKSGDWVESNYPDVKVVRETNAEKYWAPRARNIGADYTDCEWLCFIDADIRIRPGFVNWIATNMRSGAFFRSAKVDRKRISGTFGTVICKASDYHESGRFDEAFRNWGGFDSEFYERMSALGHEQISYPADFVEAISHHDEARTKFHDLKNKKLNLIVNKLYRAGVLGIFKQTNKSLPPPARENLMDQITNYVLQKSSTSPEWEQYIPARFQVELDKNNREILTIDMRFARRYLFGKKSLRLSVMSSSLS